MEPVEIDFVLDQSGENVAPLPEFAAMVAAAFPGARATADGARIRGKMSPDGSVEPDLPKGREEGGMMAFGMILEFASAHVSRPGGKRAPLEIDPAPSLGMRAPKGF